MKIIGIACVNYDRAIGYNNELLFKLKKDMELFKNITTNVNNTGKKNGVLMGYNTYKSIPHKYFPLNNRINFIISKKSFLTVGSPPVNLILETPNSDKAFVSLDISSPDMKLLVSPVAFL